MNVSVIVDDGERSVLRADEESRLIDDFLQNAVERKLRGDVDSSGVQCEEFAILPLEPALHLLDKSKDDEREDDDGGDDDAVENNSLLDRDVREKNGACDLQRDDGGDRRDDGDAFEAPQSHDEFARRVRVLSTVEAMLPVFARRGKCHGAASLACSTRSKRTRKSSRDLSAQMSWPG